MRQFRATEEANRQLLALLKEAQADPTRLMAAPNRLLESQPALRRLKDGLVDAQLRTATLQGRMSADHPEVISAREAEAQVADRLHAELATAIRGLESELTFAVSRLEMLENQRKRRGRTRLTRLAGLRANYANFSAKPATARSCWNGPNRASAAPDPTSASAKAASLISPVDGPDTGTRPISPSRWTIVLGGLLGGLLTGWAWSCSPRRPRVAERGRWPSRCRCRRWQPARCSCPIARGNTCRKCQPRRLPTRGA